MARSFASNADYIVVADRSALDVTTGVTCHAWIKTSTAPDYDVIMSKAAATWTSPYSLYGLRLEGAGVDKITFWINDLGNAANVATGSTIIVGGAYNNVWVAVGGTFDGTTMRVYLAGAQDISKGLVTSINTSAFDLFIGGDTSQNAQGAMHGSIAEVAVWNVPLTASEMAALAKGYSPALVRPSALAIL